MDRPVRQFAGAGWFDRRTEVTMVTVVGSDTEKKKNNGLRAHTNQGTAGCGNSFLQNTTNELNHTVAELKPW